MKQIIGQQGDKSNMRKLMNWLRDWEKNRKKPASKCEYTLIVKMLLPQIHVHVTSLQASMQTVQANCQRKQMKKFGGGGSNSLSHLMLLKLSKHKQG